MIRVILLGSGGAVPYADRTTTMMMTVVNNIPLLFDCGTGAGIRIAQAHINTAALGGIFLTHFHADHCVDFPCVVLASYLSGRTEALPVCGPQGVKAFVHTMMDELFPYIQRLVKNVTGAEVILKVAEVEEGVVLEGNGWTVTAGKAKHGVPALCYKIHTPHESVVMSGDTEPSEDLVALARNAELLLHECPFPDSIGFAPGHTLPSELGPIAAKAHVKCVVLTHLFEEVLGHEAEMVDTIKKSFPGEVVVGTDLLEMLVKKGEVKVLSPSNRS